MWEIRLLRGRLPRKEGGLTGMNISDFYVNLRVEVGKFYVRFLKIFYSETTGKFTLAMYFYLVFL